MDQMAQKKHLNQEEREKLEQEHINAMEELKKDMIKLKTEVNEERRKKTYDKMIQNFIETRSRREEKLNRKMNKIVELQSQKESLYDEKQRLLYYYTRKIQPRQEGSSDEEEAEDYRRFQSKRLKMITDTNSEESVDL